MRPDDLTAALAALALLAGILYATWPGRRR
jgi:hypothetical protein